MHRAERIDQPDARRVAPHQNRTARHQVHLDPLTPDNAPVLLRGILNHQLEILEPQLRVRQGMGQIKDRIVLILPVDAVQLELVLVLEPVKHHRAGLVHRRKLRRIAEQDKGGEYFLQVFELLRVQHRAFIDKADIQRLVPPLPAGDEIRTPQSRRSQSTGDRFVLLKERRRTVQRLIGQAFDFRLLTLTRQPFGDFLVFRVIDRRIQNAVDCRRRHSAIAQNAGRLVGRRKDRQRPPIFAFAPLVIARNSLDPRCFKRFIKLAQQQGLA